MVFRRKKRKIKPRTKKRQQVKGFRIGLLASGAAALLDEIAKTYISNNFYNSNKVTLPNGKNLLSEVWKNEQMKFTEEIGPRQQRTRKTQQGGSILGNIIKLGASKLLKQGGGGRVCKYKSISWDIGKRIIDKGIKHALDLYSLGTSKP